MFSKVFFSLSTITLLISIMFRVIPLQAMNSLLPAKDPSVSSSVDSSKWFIENEASVWTPEERVIVESVLSNTMNALTDAGLDGEALLGGYRFERFAGEYANDKKGKIAIAYLEKGKIVLSDSIFLPENVFYIYHELGHVIDYRSNHELDIQFHRLTLQVDGVTSLHDWTTAQGFFLRGQAHVNKREATADAFALWVYVAYAGNPVPEFPHMPENGNPDAIIQVYKEAQTLVFGLERSALSSHQ